MDWSIKFENAFSTLIKTIQTDNLDSLLTIKDLYIDLGSISNIEMFYKPIVR
jgi:hypothetical protein